LFNADRHLSLIQLRIAGMTDILPSAIFGGFLFFFIFGVVQEHASKV
jgi:hypothetical protein